jgi:hypothetical protein
MTRRRNRCGKRELITKLRSHIGGNLIAYLALFLALGGSSSATVTKLAPKNSVGTA